MKRKIDIKCNSQIPNRTRPVTLIICSGTNRTESLPHDTHLCWVCSPIIPLPPHSIQRHLYHGLYSKTSRNCNFHLQALRHIRSSLTTCCKHDGMYCYGSRIDYCNSLLLGVREQNLDRLQHVQNKITRIVCYASRHALSSDILHSLQWLPVVNELNLRQLLSVSKQAHNSVHFLCSSSTYMLSVPRTVTSTGLCNFSVARPQICNGLPHKLRQCNTLPGFKCHLKTHYFSRHMDK